MTAGSDSLRLTIGLSEVALLGQVGKSTISNWRRRPLAAAAFPQPISTRPDRFDTAEVVEYLKRTGRSNNVERLDDDAAAYSTPYGIDPDGVFGPLTALLCLQTLAGELPEAPIALLELARRFDDRRLRFYDDLEQAADDLPVLSRWVNRMASASYGPAEAFERQLAARLRRRRDDDLAPVLTSAGSNFLARLAMWLGSSADSVTYADPMGGSADVLIALARLHADEGGMTVAGTDSFDDLGRLTARRMLVHDIARRPLRTGDDGGYALSDAVLIAAIPRTATESWPTARILNAVRNLVSALPFQGCTALVLGPASALVDALDDDKERQLREKALATHRVRAIVRLPAVLLSGERNRKQQALWCIGPADPLKRVWIADLSDRKLSELAADLIMDVDTVLTDRDRRPRLLDGTAVAELLRSYGPLTASRRVAASDGNMSEVIVELDLLRHALSKPAGQPPQFTVERISGRELDRISVRQARQQGKIKTLNGAEPPKDFTGPVITVEDLRRGPPAGPGSVSGGRMTEPGDVLYATSPLVVVVDRHGGSWPSSGIKIIRSEDSGLPPDLIAADVLAQHGSRNNPQDWMLRQVPRDTGRELTRFASEVASGIAELDHRLDQLQQLKRLAIDATAGGGARITITD